MTQETDTQPQARPRRPWGKAVLAAAALAIGIPIVATVIGGVTSPPVDAVPEGHIVYMEANHPSEHTATLREMFSKGPDGTWHMLVSEQEPQDVDAGSRDWISMPVVSPDGTRVAYFDQSITLQEEIQKLDWQLYVLQVDPATQKVGKPRLLADLSHDKKAQYFGAAWTPDSKSVAILSGGRVTSYDASTGAAAVISNHVPDAAQWPSITGDGSLYFLRGDGSGQQLVRLTQKAVSTIPHSVSYGDGGSAGTQTDGHPAAKAGEPGPRAAISAGSGTAGTGEAPAQGAGAANSLTMESPGWMPAITSFAISRDGSRFAVVPAKTTDEIKIGSWDGHDVKTLKVAYGKSIFGGRHVTALKWSPSGRYIGYSVSKPPVGEDEVFYIDTATGNVKKLPFRTGRASWDWGP